MPEEALEALKQLETERDDLVSRHTRIIVRGEQAAEELKRVESEMQSLKTSPATIETDLATEKQQQTEKQTKFQQALQEYKGQVEAAEQALSNLNQTR